MTRALITGICGQDGWFLSRLLVAKGYEVHGTHHVRPSIAERDALPPEAVCHVGLPAALDSFDEIYNLAARSSVGASFGRAESTVEATAILTLRLFEALAAAGAHAKVYQSSTSEMWGRAPPPHNESTPLAPQSPYAIAKAFAHHAALMYRARGMRVWTGLAGNHESPRRPEAYVTRKVTTAAARISLGLQKKLVLGNLGARRDWGFAGDYVEAMHAMLQTDTPDDYVIATGASYTVRDLCAKAFRCVGLDWQEFVTTDEAHERPAEVLEVRPDPAKIRAAIGWYARTSFPELVRMMVEHDLVLAKEEAKR